MMKSDDKQSHSSAAAHSSTFTNTCDTNAFVRPWKHHPMAAFEVNLPTAD
jgi:hypothetical protein